MKMALPDMELRYKACMVLTGVGDALGYKNGDWEFCFDGEKIHSQFQAFGGIEKIKIKKPNWIVSDDTVMSLATAEALVFKSKGDVDKAALYKDIALNYQACMRDMAGRAPGGTTQSSVHSLRPLRPDGYYIPFNKRGGGCGAAMRSMPIGLRFAHPEEIDMLIAVSVEAGRMTHHNPTGYLGSFAGAFFTSLALQNCPIIAWGGKLMGILPKVLDYVIQEGRHVDENKKAWSYFSEKWNNYLQYRGISDGTSQPIYKPEDDTVKGRDALYKSWSFSGWGGSSGHDAPMIAYDALLAAGGSWEKLCERGMLHSGDNDSTGSMAGAWFGALYGYETVPENNFKKVEYFDRLQKAGEEIYKLTRKMETE